MQNESTIRMYTEIIADRKKKILKLQEDINLSITSLAQLKEAQANDIAKLNKIKAKNH